MHMSVCVCLRVVEKALRWWDIAVQWLNGCVLLQWIQGHHICLLCKRQFQVSISPTNIQPSCLVWAVSLLFFFFYRDYSFYRDLEYLFLCSENTIHFVSRNEWWCVHNFPLRSFETLTLTRLESLASTRLDTELLQALKIWNLKISCGFQILNPQSPAYFELWLIGTVCW